MAAAGATAETAGTAGTKLCAACCLALLLRPATESAPIVDLEHCAHDGALLLVSAW